MTEVERDTHPGALGQRGFAPTGHIAQLLEHPAHAGGVKPRLLRWSGGRTRRRCRPRYFTVQQVDTELQRILAGCVGEFVDESLKGE